jgi:indole-3-glycerol phosphate synthase
MGTVLEDILIAHRKASAADDRAVDGLAAAAAGMPPPRPFRQALAGPGLSVIAEIKRRSPSKGPLAPNLVASDLARRYEAGGAAALSVLTDGEFFDGSPVDLAEARTACALPVLRKDFTVSDADVLDARLMGADAVLLIVAALSDAELHRFRGLAREQGLAALVEVHSEGELDRALAAGADLIGVNQRNLRTFEIDYGLGPRLAGRIPSGVVKVAESGVRGPDDAAELAACGYDAILVGETLVRAADPGQALRDLLPARA